MVIYICTKFHENTLDSIKVIERTRFHRRTYQWASFHQKCRWSYGCFFSARHLMVVYICTKIHENILDGMKVTERTRFSSEKNSKGHNSVKNVCGITVLILCTSSDDGLYL